MLEQKNNRYYGREIKAGSFVDPHVLALGFRVMRRSEKQSRNDPTKGRTEEM